MGYTIRMFAISFLSNLQLAIQMSYLYFLVAAGHSDRQIEYARLLIEVKWLTPIFVRLFNSSCLLRVMKRTTIWIVSALSALSWIYFII